MVGVARTEERKKEIVRKIFDAHKIRNKGKTVIVAVGVDELPRRGGWVMATNTRVCFGKCSTY